MFVNVKFVFISNLFVCILKIKLFHHLNHNLKITNEKKVICLIQREVQKNKHYAVCQDSNGKLISSIVKLIIYLICILSMIAVLEMNIEDNVQTE